MADPARPPPESAWTESVTVREDPRLEAEFVRRFPEDPGILGIAATDLLQPRRAFWRRFGPPAPIPVERRDRMEVGRSWHHAIARRLPDEGRYEVRVRRHGIIGRIDLLADVPVEIKSGAFPGRDRLAEERPEHVEQLAIYCLLTGRNGGRLVNLVRAAAGSAEISASDLVFGDDPRRAEAIRNRAEMLRGALRSARAESLPRCRWFGRGCEFEEARVCDCTGDEPTPSSDLLDTLVEVRPRPDVERRWSTALSGAEPTEGSSRVARFRDLIYPRRTYFERTAPAEEPEAPVRRPIAIAPDLYEKLVESIESGEVGDVARLPTTDEGAQEEVVGYRGLPFLPRTSRAWSRIQAREAIARFPQYALELGFRCAASGKDEGLVILAYERAESDADRIQVLRYRFDARAPFYRLWQERVAALEEAIASRKPSGLPACPDWMYEDCPYRGECGCGPDRDRSQR